MTFVLDATFKVSLVVFAGLALASLFRRRSAAVRHWILAATIVCAAVTPILELMLPAWSIDQSRFATATARSARGPSIERPREPLASPSIEVEAVQAAPDSVQRRLPSNVLGSAWLMGSMASIVFLLTGLFRLAWLGSRSKRITTGRWAEIAGDVSREYGLSRPVMLLESQHPSLLVTWGLLTPRVIIPKAALDWSDDRIRVVLRHELAHVRRGDWIVQLAGEAVRAAYWFNPLIWIACVRLRDESEHACDDEVLKRTEGPEYATHLLELARALKAEAAPRVPAPAVARPSSLERRIRAMLDVNLVRTPTSRSVRFMTGAALFALTVGIAAAQTGPSTLSGNVVDSSGAPVPGVAVTLASTQSKAKYEVTTDQNGRYEFVPLPADNYTLEARMPGFKRAEDPISLSGKSMKRDLTLALGELTETVTIVSDRSAGGTDQTRPSSTREASPAARAAFQKDLQECQASPSGGRVRPPRKIKDVRPIYPKDLSDSGIGGTVVLRATIGTDGLVREINVVKGVHPGLDSAAVEAVRQWQFDGTLLNCTPVEVVFNTMLNFSTK